MSNPGTGTAAAGPKAAAADPKAAAADPKVVAELTAALTAAIQAMQQSAAVGGGGPRPDPRRARATRDFDVIRGLLGQGRDRDTAPPRPLPMRRTTKNAVAIDAAPPAGASVAVVHGQDGLEECVAVPTGRYTAPLELQLQQINQKTPISRVELFDAQGQFVAFGPSLPAV